MAPTHTAQVEVQIDLGSHFEGFAMAGALGFATARSSTQVKRNWKHELLGTSQPEASSPNDAIRIRTDSPN
jgi:hypothetical protein